MPSSRATRFISEVGRRANVAHRPRSNVADPLIGPTSQSCRCRGTRHTHLPRRVTLLSYVIGFLASVLLSGEAYVLVAHHELSGHGLLIVLVGLALVQLIVQLFFFLHLGRETKPRLRLIALSGVVMVILILVFGSLWIMHNLNYNHNRLLSPSQVNTYINSQDGL